MPFDFRSVFNAADAQLEKQRRKAEEERLQAEAEQRRREEAERAAKIRAEEERQRVEKVTAGIKALLGETLDLMLDILAQLPEKNGRKFTITREVKIEEYGAVSCLAVIDYRNSREFMERSSSGFERTQQRMLEFKYTQEKDFAVTKITVTNRMRQFKPHCHLTADVKPDEIGEALGVWLAIHAADRIPDPEFARCARD